MKLILDEELFLEDLENMKKYFPNLSEEEFNKTVKLDPTYTGGTQPGNYTKWLLTLANKGVLDNPGHAKDLLKRFDDNKRLLKNKDIMKFKSFEEVDNYLNDENNYNADSHRHEVKQNQKARRSVDLDKEAEKVFDGANYEIWVPHTYAASCKLGQGAKWCTASTESDYYYNFYKSEYGGEYYILIDREDPDEKYQFHFESGQFMNKEDHYINLKSFFKKNPDIEEFFRPIILNALHIDSEAEEIEYSAERFCDNITPEHNDNFLDGKYIYDIIFGNQNYLDEWFYSGYNDYSWTDGQYEIPKAINDKNKEILTNIGLDCRGSFDDFKESLENSDYAEELESVFSNAVTEANNYGAANDCVTDIEQAFKNAQINYDLDNKKIKVTPDAIIDAYLENIDQVDLNEGDDATDMILKSLANCIQVSEPYYYGWVGFDEEVFNDVIINGLYEEGFFEK